MPELDFETILSFIGNLPVNQTMALTIFLIGVLDAASLITSKKKYTKKTKTLTILLIIRLLLVIAYFALGIFVLQISEQDSIIWTQIALWIMFFKSIIGLISELINKTLKHVSYRNGDNLKIKQITNDDVYKNAVITLDYYIPVCVSYRESGAQPVSVSFSIQNENSALIDFFINANTGEILELSLIPDHITSVANGAELISCIESLEVIDGKPLIQTEIISSGDLNRKIIDFTIHYENNKFYVSPTLSDKTYKRILLPYLELIVNNNNEIIGCVFKDLPECNKEDMEAGLAVKGYY